MTEVHKIKVQALTEDAFSPFGEIIGPRSRKPDYEALSGGKIWAMDFQLSGELQFGFTWAPYLGMSFSTMEQHHGVTQSFIPMYGPPAVVAVAAPTKDHSAPRLEDIRAFLLDGTRGYVMKKGTWHSLDRFPLYEPGSGWAVLTDWETTQDLINSSDKLGDKLTKTVDFEKDMGITFEFAL